MKEIPYFRQVGGKENYFKNAMSFRRSPESKKRKTSPPKKKI
jgi:hypothetical protein